MTDPRFDTNGCPSLTTKTTMRPLLRTAVWLGLAFAIAFQAVAPVQSQTQQQIDPEILAAYNAAIYDSSVYKFSNLRPLKPLVFDPTNRTTVVSLTWREYHQGTKLLERDVWVTPVPEVKELCQKFTGDVTLRLKQLLGLHPASSVIHFVEISVKREDVFRPALDPDTANTLPCACPIPPTCGLVFPKTSSRDPALHFHWIAEQTLNSYVISESPQIPVGYPWTRLGYTYDWRPQSSKYGASEYVISKGASVTILAEPIPIETYCRPKK